MSCFNAASAIFASMLFGDGNSGADENTVQFPILGISALTTNGTYQWHVSTDNEGWCSFSGDQLSSIITPTAWEPKDATWEFIVAVKLTSEPTRSNVLFGSHVNFYYAPSMEIQASRKIWCGYSTSGSTWDYALSSQSVLSLNKEYLIKYSWDGSQIKLELSEDDGTTWTTEATRDVSTSHYQYSSAIVLGGVARSVQHSFACGKINLLKTRFMIGNKIVLGA